MENFPDQGRVNANKYKYVFLNLEQKHSSLAFFAVNKINTIFVLVKMIVEACRKTINPLMPGKNKNPCILN